MKPKTNKTPITALVVPAKRNALKSVLAARGESIQDWLERLVDREIKWTESRPKRTGGQDRESYSDTQDRKSYAAK